MPHTKKDGQVRFENQTRYIPDKERECLTEDQARHVNKMVEIDIIINIESMKQEIEDNQLTRNKLKEEDNTETIPYKMAILNQVSRDDIKTEQMIHWSILSDLIKYSSSDMIPSITVKPIDYWKHKRLYHNLKTDKDTATDVIIEGDKLKDECFDKYKGIYAEILQATKFDESMDLSTTYLGKRTWSETTIIKAEEKFPIYGKAYTNGKLLDNTECSILINTGASKSYMSKSYYMQCTSLHALPEFVSSMQRVQVGKGQCVAVLFIIPVIVDVCRHRFKVSH